MNQRIRVKFDLYCDSPVTYRIYFDDTLITERDYIWDNKHQIIRETFEVMAKNVPHTISILSSDDAILSIANTEITHPNISFIVDKY